MIERLQGRGAAQSVALSMEYDWQAASGYARGALADKYLRRLGDVDLPKDAEVKDGDQKGDRERWERSWEITGPQLTEQKLAALLDKVLALAWSKTGSDKTGQQTSWAFKGDDGRPWKALAMVKPAPGAANRFVMTVSVEQTPQH